MNFITERISVKIVVALLVVMLVNVALFTVLLVRERGDVLQDLQLSKARGMAGMAAHTMAMVLENALSSGQFTEEQLFDTDYREITSGSLAGTAIPKYHTAYDKYLDWAIRDFQNGILDQDPMVVYAVLSDRNGYVPTHNTKYSLPLTGDAEKDKVGNRTKRIFNDEVGLKAAHYDGKDGQQILRQIYKRDTGETMWDITAPVNVRGKHWGGFRIGFSMQQSDAALAALRNTVIWNMLVVLLVAAITNYFVVSYFMRPLRRVTEAAERMSEGQLDQTVEIESQDEIGTLAKAFNRMTQEIVKSLQGEVEKSNRLVIRVKEAIQQLSTSANELMAISTQQSSGATEQASAVQEATTTSEEIAVTARQVAEIALRVETQSEQASTASAGGTQAVANATGGMARLKEQVQSIAGAMLELGENSQKIGGIVDIIDEISDQTNLLSLNAAIEAAGAGEAGKRFSIVANEVKRLAERTVDATGQIKALVDQIQKATNSTIMLTEEGTKGVDAANQLVAQVSEALTHIHATIEETTGAAREIKLSTQQQTTASEQMAETIAEVRDVAAQVATGAQETASAITELTNLAETLREQLEQGLQSKGEQKAQEGARLMERILVEAIAKGRLTETDLFDENYQPIPNTDPQKFHTKYDRYLDPIIQPLEDEFLKDQQVTFAVLVDHNGYLPTHNSKYCQPLTGDREKDLVGNRTKRMFNGDMELKAARNDKDILVQVYHRDTGEKMWDISYPVFVNGRHFGAFRLGYRL